MGFFDLIIVSGFVYGAFVWFNVSNQTCNFRCFPMVSLNSVFNGPSRAVFIPMNGLIEIASMLYQRLNSSERSVLCLSECANILFECMLMGIARFVWFH